MEGKWENRSNEDDPDILEGIDDCHCSDCDWNDNGHCIIYKDNLVTLSEDCPYRDGD